MGLSEEDRRKHPYFMDMAREPKEKEKERWERFTESKEYVRSAKAYQRAIENFLYQAVLADFYSKKLEATVEQVASATSFWTTKLCDSLFKSKFYLTEKMLERFDLVKKEKGKVR